MVVNTRVDSEPGIGFVEQQVMCRSLLRGDGAEFTRESHIYSAVLNITKKGAMPAYGLGNNTIF